MGSVAMISEASAAAYGPGLHRAGPISANHGFPEWYQDKTGLALEIGTVLTQGELDGGWVLLLPGDTTAPESYVFPPTTPTQFFDEHFYWHCAAQDRAFPLPPGADPRGATTTSILVEMGHEAAFSSGAEELPGSQIVFTRIRVVLGVVPYSGSYVLETPYKTYNFPNLIAGDRLFYTDDFGVAEAPEGFQASLRGPLGPYLLPASSEGGPELAPVTFEGRQYIADPTRVNPTDFATGSPLNKNLVRLTGPNGLDWSTNRFEFTGRIKTGAIPSNVALTRASKFDAPGDRRIDIFAKGAPTLQTRLPQGPIALPTHPGITVYPLSPVRDTNGNLTLPAGAGGRPMVDNGPLGTSYYLQWADLPAIPSEVTAMDDGGFITAIPVTDTVVITKADYSALTKTLTVDAVTANLNTPATFYLSGVDGVTSNDTFTSTISIPNLNAPPAKVTVFSTQGGASTVDVTVGVPVSANNHAPLAVADTIGSLGTSQVVIPVLLNDTDPDGDRLSIDSVVQPVNGFVTVTDLGTTLTFQPNAGVSGTVTFDYTVTDRRGGFSTATVTVLVDGAPLAGADVALATTGVATTINVLDNDTDPDLADIPNLTVVAVTPPVLGATALGTVSITGAGRQVQYTPNSGTTGVHIFTYTVSDGRGGTSVGQVSVTVNTPPTAVADAVYDLDGQSVLIDVLVNDSDIDAGDTITITAVGSNPRATVAIDGGGIRFTPLSGVLAVETFDYTISDGRGGVATTTVTVEQNRTPAAAADSLSANAGVTTTLDVIANDTDLDLNPLVISGYTQPTNGVVGVTADARKILFSFNPGATLGDTFTYTVTDGKQGFSTASVAVSLNHLPVAVADTATVLAGNPVVINVTANDTDADTNNVLVVTSATAPAGSTVVVTGTDSITFTSGPAPAGTPQTVTYTVSDGVGGTATGTVTITVNSPPVAVADSVTTSFGVPVTINVLANDTDPNNDALTVTGIGTQSPNGLASVVTSGVQANRAVFFSPNVQGVSTFTYIVSDGRGGTATGTVTVTTTAPANRVPLAANDSATTVVGTAVVVNVLANDSDPDGDALTVTAITQPAAGTVAISNVGRSVTFTPNVNSSVAAQTFNYTISDGRGGTATAQVSVVSNDRVTITSSVYRVSTRAWTLAGTAGPGATVTIRGNNPAQSLITVTTADTRGAWRATPTVANAVGSTAVVATSSQRGTAQRNIVNR